MKVIGYIRVSTGRQAIEGISLDAQRDAIKQWAKLHGHELLAIEADEGVSGKRADNRPGFAKAMRDSCDEQAILVAYSLSRLARNVPDAYSIVSTLQKRGAQLALISESIDTTSAAGRMFFGIMAVLAAFEREQTAERTKAIMRHKQAKGEVVGSVPYGYAKVQPEDPTQPAVLVKNEEEQRVIGMIRYLRRTKSVSEVAQILKEKGVKPRGKRWHEETIRRIERRNG